jgi:hypothetical protein
MSRGRKAYGDVHLLLACIAVMRNACIALKRENHVHGACNVRVLRGVHAAASPRVPEYGP